MNCIRLVLPLCKENILIARLTAAGAGSLAGLDIDGVEDVKVAVNEAAVLLLKQGYLSAAAEFGYENGFTFHICGEGSAKCAAEENEIAILLLNELVKDVEIVRTGNSISAVSFSKK